MKRTLRTLAASVVLGGGLLTPAIAADISQPNVSCDPTRALYQAYNAAFAGYWKDRTGDTVTIKQSHGGSGKQARWVIDGLEGDAVTPAPASDVDALHVKCTLIPADWRRRLPHNASPRTSTIVFLVRKGNPKGVKDRNDPVKRGRVFDRINAR
jgi:sulfate/thiosulfate-binding protein